MQNETNRGWICLHRQTQDCAIWVDEEPFDRRSAWVDLLLSCNHRDKDILFNGHPLTIKRGQYLTSVRKLAERWHWSNDRTLRYLRLLEELEMIKKSSDRFRTLITIVKYEVYQDIPNTDKDTNEDTNEDTDKSQTTMINNVNNNKDNMSTDIDSIVAYLNLKAGTHYQSSTPKTRTLIKARFKEHFTVDDFKTVIDKMTAAWINDSKMRQYLRPETLFGTKFEGYLNRDYKPVTKKGSFNDMMHTEYDMEALEKMLNE